MASKVYFPGLNSLRFFAAFAVIITHVELMKKLQGFKTNWDLVDPIAMTPLQAIIHGPEFKLIHPIVAEAGPLGVVFFFVLSGFLITYLLFAEKQETKKIAVKAFYFRRIFRIWPLYYFIFILGFFVLPQFELFQVTNQSEYLENNFWLNFSLFLIILPNLALAFSPYGSSVPNIGQSWSIGVEEQFYLVWPLIIKFSKRPILAIVYVTGIYLLIKVVVVFWSMSNSQEWLIVLKKFLAMSKIECMTIGGLGAYWIFYKKEGILKVFYSRIVQILAILAIPILLFCTPFFLQDGVHLAFAVCFLIIILNVSTNPRRLFSLDNKLFDYLGKVSYGIYMYHLMVIVLVINFCKIYLGWENSMSLIQNIMVYSVSVLLTIGISALSYEYLEQPFIRLKRKYAKIKSGEDARI